MGISIRNIIENETVLYETLVSGDTFMIPGEDEHDIYMVTDEGNRVVHMIDGKLSRIMDKNPVIEIDIECDLKLA